MGKVHNFSAGPSILPQEVIQKAAEAVLNFNNSSLSLLEVSHRGKDVVAFVDHSIALIKEILGVPEGYSVIYMQGGASLQFHMVPLNLLKPNGKAGYIDTGTWANNAIKEAKRIGNTQVLASSADQKYTYIPKNVAVPADLDYLHLTTNNTIYGTEFFQLPNSPVPIVADMSSDIFSRPINVADYGMIYAGAQKNLGPAGVTLAIVRNDLLGKHGRDLSPMLDYNVYIDKESMFNTPPVFAMYVCMLTLEWLKANGGLTWIEQRNIRKAELLYNEIDRNPLFVGTVATEDRSRMNATFLLKDEAMEPTFNAILKEARISGLAGHRSVGGYRASMYNAMDVDSVQALVDAMKEMERRA